MVFVVDKRIINNKITIKELIEKDGRWYGGVFQKGGFLMLLEDAQKVFGKKRLSQILSKSKWKE